MLAYLHAQNKFDVFIFKTLFYISIRLKFFPKKKKRFKCGLSVKMQGMCMSVKMINYDSSSIKCSISSLISSSLSTLLWTSSRGKKKQNTKTRGPHLDNKYLDILMVYNLHLYIEKGCKDAKYKIMYKMKCQILRSTSLNIKTNLLVSNIGNAKIMTKMPCGKRHERENQGNKIRGRKEVPA